ncbi:unnamed protein product [Camellia sinensis]
MAVPTIPPQDPTVNCDSAPITCQTPDLMANSPPASPARFRSPLMFASQVSSLHFTPLLQLIDYVNHSKIKIEFFISFCLFSDLLDPLF